MTGDSPAPEPGKGTRDKQDEGQELRAILEAVWAGGEAYIGCNHPDGTKLMDVDEALAAVWQAIQQAAPEKKGWYSHIESAAKAEGYNMGITATLEAIRARLGIGEEQG